MGDVVLLVDVIEPRSSWPLGLVMHVKKGRDGNVRTVTTEYGVQINMYNVRRY